MSPIAGKIAAVDETRQAEAPIMQPTLVAETSEDPETFEQLRHIQRLLADIRTEFQPVTAAAPEVTLVFDAPHPFAEPFEEEEVVADRYAAAGPPPAASLPVAKPAPNTAAVALAAPANVAEPAIEGEDGEEDKVQAWATSADRQPEARPRNIARKRFPGRTTARRPGKAQRKKKWPPRLAVPNEDLTPRPVHPVVPPPRQNLGRLFAGLRRGL